MKQIELSISVQVNHANGSVGAVYFQVRRGRAAKVRELANGNAFANYDINGRLLGVELLAPCEIAVLDQITKKESMPVKNFLRNSIPVEMVA